MDSSGKSGVGAIGREGSMESGSPWHGGTIGYSRFFGDSVGESDNFFKFSSFWDSYIFSTALVGIFFLFFFFFFLSLCGDKSI